MVNYLEETFGLKDGQFIDPNVVIAFGGDVDDALAKVAPEQLMDALLKQVCGHVYDSDDPHMAETPRRFVKMLGELTDSSETFTFTMFESDSREMVIERNISFVSVCAHHLAPFVGTCQLGYIPDGKIAGLSKFPRHIQAMARTLTNQEDLTRNIVESLMDILEPRGVALVSDAMPPAAGGPDVFELQGRRMTRVGNKLTAEDGTLAGAAITMRDAVEYLVHVLEVPLADALMMATLTPARLLRVDNRIGRLKPGLRADLVHLTDDLQLAEVWMGGRRLNEVDAAA